VQVNVNSVQSLLHLCKCRIGIGVIRVTSVTRVQVILGVPLGTAKEI
jgi:hypothetical protein